MSSQSLASDGRVVSEHPLGVYGGITLPYAATFVCWHGPFVACQAALHGVNQPWDVITFDATTGAITTLSGPSNIVRASASAVLYQAFGCAATWTDGTVTHYPDEGWPMDADGLRVLCADPEKQRLTVYTQVGMAVRFRLVGGGLTSDDNDGPGAQLLGDLILARTDRYRLYSATTGTELPIPVYNAMANYVVLYLAPDGRLMLVERQLVSPPEERPERSRLTVRYADAHLGGVLAEGAMDFFGINARPVGMQASAVWFRGQNYTGMEQQWHARDFSDLPQVDVTTPPLIPPLPMPVAPIGSPLSVGWYFAYHHPEWVLPPNSPAPGAPVPGTPFPDIDPSLPKTAIYPLSYEELMYAIDLSVPVLAHDEFDAQLLAPHGLLWAFNARNEDGSDLQAHVDALVPLCVKYDAPMLVYNDQAFSAWPTRWPSYAVASLKLFYEQHEPLESWRSRARAIIQQFQAAFPGVPIDLCPSAFDRNLTGWLPNELGNLQTVCFDLAREFHPLGCSPFNWGRGTADLTIGGAYQHLEIHQRWLALAPAIPAPSVWPKPSDFPPPPPEETDMNWTLWTVLLEQLDEACYCAKLSTSDTANTIALSKARFIGQFVSEQWPAQRNIHFVLQKRWPTLTLEQCQDAKGVPLTVSTIASGRS